MSIWMLRLRLLLATTIFIAISTLAFTIILSVTGLFNLYLLATFVILFNLIQWLIAPKIINSIYRVREPRPGESWLVSAVDELSRRSGIKTPKVFVAEVPIPNAFAYGSPLTGNMVAVTTGLLETLDRDEVVAVLGHEVGHLKHRDVQIMMLLSILPSVLYFIGYSLYFSSLFNRDRGGGLLLVGLLSILLYYVLSLIVLWVSRLREYYADLHAAQIVENGNIKLANALVKIVYGTTRYVARGGDVHRFSAVKPLLIADPDTAIDDLRDLAREGFIDRRVLELARRRLRTEERIMELFSTHPHIVNRLRRLLSYSR